MWRHNSDRCPIVEECDARFRALDDEMNAIARGSIYAARDLRDVAAKLMVWRAETLLLGPSLELQRDAFAFATYRDVMRLAGFEALAHPLDARTSAQVQSWDGE